VGLKCPLDRLGLGLAGVPYTTHEIVELAKIVEEKGFDSIWVAEDYLLRDAITTLAAVATATSRVRLGLRGPNPIMFPNEMSALAEPWVQHLIQCIP